MQFVRSLNLAFLMVESQYITLASPPLIQPPINRIFLVYKILRIFGEKCSFDSNSFCWFYFSCYIHLLFHIHWVKVYLRYTDYLESIDYKFHHALLQFFTDTFSVKGSIQLKNTTVSIYDARTVGAIANIPANANKQSWLGLYSDFLSFDTIM